MRSVLTVRRSWSAAGCHRYLCAALQWCESPQAPLLHFCISEQSQSSSVHSGRPRTTRCPAVRIKGHLLDASDSSKVVYEKRVQHRKCAVSMVLSSQSRT